MRNFCERLQKELDADGTLDVSSLSTQYNDVQLIERAGADASFLLNLERLSGEAQQDIGNLVAQSRDIEDGMTDWTQFATLVPNTALGLMRGTCLGLDLLRKTIVEQ